MFVFKILVLSKNKNPAVIKYHQIKLCVKKFFFSYGYSVACAILIQSARTLKADNWPWQEGVKIQRH